MNDNRYNPTHTPIMVDEIINFLSLQDNRTYLDATTGEGGHSEKFLQSNDRIKMVCNDRDGKILNKAKIRLGSYVNNIKFTNLNFCELGKSLEKQSIDGIIADLGISSFHFDIDDRGFTFNREENLDMRLDNSSDVSAYDIVNSFDEQDIANIIYKYGEERFSRRIAKNIVNIRPNKSINTTTHLKEIVEDSIPKRFYPKKIHPATRTFQALRIYVNEELTSIEKGIDEFIPLMTKGARLCILTFHSLEDRIVKNKFRELSGYAGNRDPLTGDEPKPAVVKIITRKPIMPSNEEIQNNPRSRSSKLRVVEKI